jgi:predicted ArsR family transcriptional regulator
MTPANARHHLEILLEEGAVQVIGQHKAKSRGRPSQVYSLSEGLLGYNYDRLAAVLLDDYGNGDDGRLRQLAMKMVNAAGFKIPAKKESLTEHLFQAMLTLNAMHYSARWEARSGAPRVIFTHCPYRSILDDHPELCLLDVFMLSFMVNAPVEQTSRLADDWKGGKSCIFLVMSQ